MKILYITYIDMKSLDSGSGVRPNKIYQAMIEEGHEVYMLSGNQSRRERESRRKKVDATIRWLDTNQVDMCYIESPTYPIMYEFDISLIHRIKKRGIPVAYFYRDFYRRFPNLFPHRKGFANGLKELYLDYRQYRTDRAIECVDIIYLPSQECTKLFNYKDMRILPPAGENRLTAEKEKNKIVIYVGGIAGDYGFNVLLDAFEILNKEGMEYKLICVCRKKEFDNFSHRSKNAAWLTVAHVSGKTLSDYYNSASAAVIPIKNNEYYNLAVPVKLFEYMSYGIPIVATRNDSIDRIIQKYQLGIVTEQGAENLAKGIEEIFSDELQYEKYRGNVKNALLQENMWKHRVQQIVSDLSELRENYEG